MKSFIFLQLHKQNYMCYIITYKIVYVKSVGLFV